MGQPTGNPPAKPSAAAASTRSREGSRPTRAHSAGSGSSAVSTCCSGAQLAGWSLTSSLTARSSQPSNGSG
eukprot:5047940-Alexandrium_andersonii.AAC.1